MALALALGLYLSGNPGSGEPPTPSAPVFASEPGTLDEITEAGVYTLGFVRASGYPSSTYVLSGAVPDGVEVLVGGLPIDLPATIPWAAVTSLSLEVLPGASGEFDLLLTATNSEGSDTAAADGSVETASAGDFWQSFNLTAGEIITGEDDWQSFNMTGGDL